MKKLVILTGVRGAGKTTLVRWLHNQGIAKPLKPFTTRAKRSKTDDEYYFFRRSAPPAANAVAWRIDVAGNWYGMLNKEIDAIDAALPGVTVFEPTSLQILYEFRESRPDLELIVVGLDTIQTSEEQRDRVNHDKSRILTQEEIDSVRKIVQEQDVTLKGDLETVKSALQAVFQLISGRGGIVSRDVLLPLCQAGALLDNFEPSNLQAASYDLRVGREMWCQGRFIDLNDNDDRFAVPPYSYAIVKALEQATVPAFMAGTFDIKVSHFFSGMILSNGPQVDPGYRGDLFCMLFNGNSSPRTLVMGEHFSTIEFTTVTRNSPRYMGPYSFRDKLRSVMPIGSASGPGGAIFSRIDEKVGGIRKELRLHQGVMLGTAAILSAVALSVTAFAFTAAERAYSQGQVAANAAFEANRERALLSDELKLLREREPADDTRSDANTRASSHSRLR